MYFFWIILWNDILSTSCEVGLRWVPQNPKSTLVQVMTWCHQTTSHYLSQCWTRSMAQYGITRPQWVNCHLTKLSIRGHFNIMTIFPRLGIIKIRYVRVSYLYNGNSYPGKMASKFTILQRPPKVLLHSFDKNNYCQSSNISTKSQNLNASHLILQLSLLNPLKPGVKSRMKM